MKRILILDANSILHRAFHALPPLTTKKGELVNAVYGFLLVFFKVIKEFQPNSVFACFDFPAKTFRHKEFKEYKATRPPMPKDLSSQIPKIKEILNAFSVPVLEKEGYEADDLIGTICKKFPEEEKIIVSGDSDLLQLIDERTKVYLLKTGVKNTVLYDKHLIEKEYGLKPEQVLDFKALIGDSSDNVPGVRGIGEKTAIKLIKEFGDLETLYKKIEEENTAKISQKIKKILIEQKQNAFFGKKILEIKKDVPLEISLKNFWAYDEEKIMDIFKNFGFKSLIKRLFELRKIKKDDKMENKYQKSLF